MLRSSSFNNIHSNTLLTHHNKDLHQSISQKWQQDHYYPARDLLKKSQNILKTQSSNLIEAIQLLEVLQKIKHPRDLISFSSTLK